ncbi:PKD domain-containing protein [Chitinophaga sp. B61]|uniref:PKD domain-containing protein n=2 Tax=Chitinophaga rhizophila TaxID=2866212 RepID=A0ABS7GJN5_9BACT|nr:PKD domain-containing protein [Chitinophaga rhizophila]
MGVSAYSQIKADFSPTKISDCESLITKFVDNSVGGPVSWQWNLGNGFTSTEQSPSASYTAPGNYTVTLTAKDAAGNTSVAVKTVTVWGKPKPDFAASPAKGCTPFEVTFTDKSDPVNGTMATYTWDFGDGASGTGSSPVHTYNNAISPTVTLTVTNSNGCTASKTINNVVEAAAPLIAGFTLSDKFLCTAPGSLTVTNTTTGPGNLTYQWDFGDGGTATGANPAPHSYKTRGVYNVKLTVTSDKGCTATRTSEDINVANFNTDFVMPAGICENASVIFNAANTPSANYVTWSVDKGYINGANESATFYPSEPGTVKVTMTAEYDKCRETVTKDYVVKPAPRADFTTDQEAICDVPATVKLSNLSQNATSWSWDFGNGQTSTQQNPSATYNSLGNYTIRLTATNASGCTSNIERYVRVVKPEVQISASHYTGCVEITPTFEASVTTDDPIATYEWDFGDGSPKSTAATPSHKYTKDGVYPVTLNYVTTNGCKGTAMLNRNYDGIRVYKKPKPDFSSPQAPQVCGNNWVTFNGISDVGEGWAWDFGDHSYGYGQNAEHSYRDPGTYTVALTVSNHGCSETITKTAYITAVNPFPRFTVMNVKCEDRTEINFAEHSLGTVTSWKWSWGDGKEDTYTSKIDFAKHRYAQMGDYKVKLTVTDGTCTSTDSINVGVYPKAPITIATDKTTLCGNETVIGNVTAIDSWLYAPENVYTWYSSDGTSPDWNNYNYDKTSFTNLRPGIDTIRLVMKNRQECFDTSNYVVLNVHGPVAKFVNPDLLECRGTPLTFKDQTDISKGKPIKSWSWDFGDGTSELFTNPPFRHTYHKSGYFYPSLRVTDADGCISTATNPYLQVNGPNADFTPSAALIPPGANVSFYNQTSETGGNATYKWDFGDNTTSVEYSPVKNYPDKGLYTVKLMVKDNNGCTDSAQKQVKVSHVSAGFTVTTAFVNNSGCPPVIARFTNASVNYTSSYWDFGDGSFSTISDPSHTYTYAGKYKVKLKVTGEAGTEDEYVQEVEVKGPFATIITSSDGGCLTKEIEFRVATSAAVNFAWDFTDGIVMETNDSIIKHTFKQPGIYKPRLILSDEAGCKGTAFLQEPIVVDKLEVELVSEPDIICDKGWITFNPTFSSYSIDDLKKPATYAWSYEPGIVAQGDTTANPRFYLDKVKEYDFTLTTTTAYGCAQTVSKKISVHPKPEAGITGPPDGCQDAPVQFSGTVSKVNDVAWNWNFGNGNVASIQQPADQTYSLTGPAEVVLTVVSREGCSDTARHNINILPKPVINATAAANMLCLGDSTVLSAGGGITYEWSPANSLNNPAVARPVATPLENTTYQVSVTDDKGCSNTDEVSIRVTQPFTIQATPDTAICLGHILPLRVTGADHYTWKGEGLDNVSSPMPNATIQALGRYTYQVTGYDADGCFTHDTSLVVAVNPAPAINVGPDRMVMAGTPLTLSGQGSSDIVRWNWTPPEYLNCPTCATPEALPNLSTNYTLEVENVYGCKASDDVFVKVTCDKGAVFLPNAFSPNRDGKNEWFYPTGRGVKEIVWMRVYDRWGSLVFERTHFSVNSASSGWDGTWKSQIAPIGTYVYALETMCEDGTTFLFRGTVTVVR